MFLVLSENTNIFNLFFKKIFMRMICVHEFLDVNKNMHTLFNVSIGED